MPIIFQFHEVQYPKGTVVFEAKAKSKEELSLIEQMLQWRHDQFGKSEPLGKGEFSAALFKVDRTRLQMDDTGAVQHNAPPKQLLTVGEGVEYELILGLTATPAMNFKLAWSDTVTFVLKQK